MSKGSNRRPYDKKKWDERFENIFAKDCQVALSVGSNEPKILCIDKDEALLIMRKTNTAHRMKLFTIMPHL